MSALVPYKDSTWRSLKRLPRSAIAGGRARPEEARLSGSSRAVARTSNSLAGGATRRSGRSTSKRRQCCFLGVEDFGIVPVEAQACGTPVVALAEGGACETVVDGTTGVLVSEATAQAFADGIRRVVSDPPHHDAVRSQAERFSREAFKQAFTSALAESLPS